MPLPAAMPAKTSPGRTRRAGLRPPTLAERFSARHNALGVLRLGLASAVIVGHARPLGGFDKDQFGHELTAGQTNIGALAVYGFFVLSGFLITGSGLRFPLGRYAWHRFLRIFPGLWVCLLVTAFVIAPLVALYERGNLDGFWHHPQGPVSYVTANLFPAWQRSTISGLLSETPLGQALGGRPTSFDTSLWTLRYELACYALVGALLATRVLRRAPRAVVLLAALCWLVLLRDTLGASTLTAGLRNRGSLGPFPVIGQFSVHQLLCLGFLFLLGASARLYRHRIPMHGALAALAGGVLAVSLWQGGFFVLGLPAYAYLLFYLAVALPGPFRRIGRARDYSYGIYIYGWPVQQVIALVGGARYGLPVYVLLSVLGTLALAVPSWHLVERPAMRLKDRPLPAALRRARRPAAPRPLVWSTTTVPLPASAREHAARRAARRELADSPAAGHASPAKTT
ncbi:acyltransferase [Micromonospora sp. B11E3]|uniref:acyltransferase family protein n=1 Tax=Micromonospora sp. B11E3 TaxID=3153562 RepID=UPI00325C7E79